MATPPVVPQIIPVSVVPPIVLPQQIQGIGAGWAIANAVGAQTPILQTIVASEAEAHRQAISS